MSCTMCFNRKLHRLLTWHEHGSDDLAGQHLRHAYIAPMLDSFTNGMITSDLEHIAHMLFSE